MKKIFDKKISFRNYPILFALLFLTVFYSILSVFNLFVLAPKILMLIVLFSIALSLGKTSLFLKDWFVFLAFLYLADTLRGLIYVLTCRFHLPVYTLYVINLEKLFFNSIPSVVLQNMLMKGSDYFDLTWFEKILTVLHGTHFVAFLLVGLIIWLHRSDYFPVYKASFTSLILSGLGVYMLVPTVPPWIASELFKIIPEINHFTETLYTMNIPDLTMKFNSNPVAAMPSLHTAFPALASLLLWRIYRWKAFPFYIYTGLICFTIVYSGDHYVIDIIAGLVLAFLCLFIILRIKRPDLVNQEKKDDRPRRFDSKYRYLLAGFILFALALLLGYFAGNQSESNKSFQDIHTAVPNYVDFFQNMQKYESHYHIQFYYGNHLLHKGEYERALTHYRKALRLSENLPEKSQALIRIKQCERLLKDQDR